MDIEEWIRDDADLVVDAKIIIHLGSLIPSNLIASHITFVIVLDNLLPPNTGSGFYLFCESYSPVEASHEFSDCVFAAFTWDACVLPEEGELFPPPASEPGSGGVTLLGPEWR